MVQLVVHQAGVNLQRTVPGLQIVNIHLDEYFSIVHPEVTFTISSIRKFINSHFVMQTRREMMPETWKGRPMLQLRGKKKETFSFSYVCIFFHLLLFVFRSDDLDAFSALHVISSLSFAEKPSGAGGNAHAHF